jgi:hypothetical protein
MMRAIAAVAVAGVLVLTGCGGSSKPAYCSDRSNLEQSVKDLGNVDLKNGGVSALDSQLQKVKSDSTTLVNSAKSDFPSQTAAIQSSVTALSSAAQALPSSPSAQQIATIALDVKNVATAVSGFTDATDSKCK